VRALPAITSPDPTNQKTALGSQVRSGALWAGASSILLKVANIAVMAVVVRIVAPAEFGIYSLALVVYGVVVGLAELGVASAVARADLDDRLLAPTVATVAIVSALIMGASMYFLAEPLAVMLGSAAAANPIRVLSICVALIGPFAVPGAQMQREFRQAALFKANAVSFVVSNALLIVLALNIDGAMAFAWSRVVGHVVVGLAMMFSVSKKYWPGWRGEYVGPLLRYGLPLAVANLLSQLALNIDYAIVGRVLSATDVGVYALAFNVSLWSTALLGGIFSVVVPAFSRVRGEGGDQVGAFTRAARLVAMVSFPVAAVTIALADPLITTLYGVTWSRAAPVLRVLAVYGMLFVLGLLMASIIAATGRSGSLLAVQVALCVALIPALWFGAVRWGLVGVAVGHVAVICLISVPAYLIVIRSAVGLRFRSLAAALVWPTLASAMIGAVSWFSASLSSSSLWRLLIGGVAAGIAFLVLLGAELTQVIPSQWKGLRRLVEVVGAPVRRLRTLFTRHTESGATG
jgi:lipopolysaccharide exporter